MTARVLSTLRPSEVADDRSRQSFSLYQFLGDIGSLISDFTCCDACYCSVVCLSVMFVHCAQMAEDIDPVSFACNSL